MYQIHVLTQSPNEKEPTFKPVRPTGGKPYEYPTQHEAESMAKMCYPLQAMIGAVKAVKV